MDSFEFNKVAGALLGALLFTLATGLIADSIFAPAKLVKPGYALPAAAEATAATAAKPAAPAVPIAELLAKADPKKGEGYTKPCQACHNFEKGAGSKIGPPLWDVVGRAKASVPGFAYSAGLKAKGGKWTYDDLNIWLTDPAAYVSGTKMTFAGIAEADHRADIIAYLRTLSDHPLPLPPVAPAVAAKPAPASAPAAKPAATPAPAAAPKPAPAK